MAKSLNFIKPERMNIDACVSKFHSVSSHLTKYMLINLQYYIYILRVERDNLTYLTYVVFVLMAIN